MPLMEFVAYCICIKVPSWVFAGEGWLELYQSVSSAIVKVSHIAR